jgi:MFS family permease
VPRLVRAQRRAHDSSVRVPSSFRAILANPDIRRAELAWTLGVAAEWAWLVTLLVYANQAGGIGAVGLASLMRTLPAGLAAPFVTAVTDRYSRDRVLLGMHLCRGAIVAIAAIAMVAGMPVGLVFGAALLEGLLATLHRPSNASLLPGLARSPDELVAGNAVASTMEGVGMLAGPAIGGLVLASAGTELAAALAAGAFGLAAVVIRGVQPARFVPRASRGRIVDALAGLSALKERPIAGVLVGAFGAQTFVRGLLTVLIVSASIGPLALGEGGVGYLNAAIGAGGLLGAVAAMALIGRRRLALPFVLFLAAWGLPITVLGLIPTPIAAILLLAAVGVANAFLDVSGFSLIQRIVPNQVRGRVFGAFEGLVALTVGLGSATAPLLVTALDVQGALVVSGLVLPLVALAVATVVRRADTAAVVPERELALLRSIPFFAPLPMTSLEALASALTARHVVAGTTLIREGEAGTRFHMLSSGAADVTADGHLLRRLRRGDGCGEIALLRDVPRTATVTVTEDAEVYDLDRESFLEAVTGCASSLSAANAFLVGRMKSA